MPTHVAPSPVSGEDVVTSPLSQRTRFRWLAGSYLIVTAALVAASVLINRGGFVYVLDDSHIHLTIARNLAEHGTWGVLAGSYESASSSPMWTLILAGGWWLWPLPFEWLPLAIGVAASLWGLWLFSAVDVRLVPDRRSRWNLAGLAVMPVILFLPGLTMTGMEHTLQVAFVLWAFTVAWRRLEAARFDAVPWDLMVPVALLCATRFEGAFVAFGLALALWVAYRRSGPSCGLARGALRCGAVAVLAAGGVPLVVSSAVNVAFGQYLVPNSVAAKSAFGSSPVLSLLPDPAKLGANLSALAFDWVLLGVAIVLCVRLRRERRRLGEPLTALTLAWVVAAALHLTYAGMGWYERYQAYLIAAGLWLLFRGGEPLLRRSRGAVAAVVAVGVLFVLPVQKWAYTANAVPATRTVWTQQHAMGEFLSMYYSGRPVALHDIGHVGWQHDGPMVDLVGLADFEVLQMQKTAPLDRDAVGDLLERRHAEVLVIHDALMGHLVPDGWVRVATWKVPPGLRLTDWNDTVTWYAPRGRAAEELRGGLERFAGQLPPGATMRLEPEGTNGHAAD